MGSFIVIFREAFEAILIIGLLLTYLHRSGRLGLKRYVGIGVGAALILSGVLALVFERLAGGFEGQNEAVFEGVAMITASLLLTGMVLWLISHKPNPGNLTGRIAQSSAAGWTVFLIAFLSVLREGVETVLFFAGMNLATGVGSLIWSLAGLAAALLLGLAMFKGGLRLNFNLFFRITNALLILIAAGLIAHGVHELEEAGWITVWSQTAWDINPAVGADGSYPLMHEKGVIGALLKGMFGYNGNPSVIEVVSYLVWLTLVGTAAVLTERKHSRKQAAAA